VRWEINPPSTAYLLSNNCTKNYWNWTTAVKIIAESWVVYFFCNTVHMLCCLNSPDLLAARKAERNGKGRKWEGEGFIQASLGGLPPKHQKFSPKTFVGLTVVSNRQTDRHIDQATCVATGRIFAFCACDMA